MIEEPGIVASGGIVFDSLKHGQHFNFNSHNATNFNGIDERTLYYVQLADSTTTSHIVNQHNVFKTYEPIKDTPITSIGGLWAQAEGCSDIDVYTIFNGKTHTIHLQDVLYMPGNRNNLFSLRHWLANGGDFLGHDLTLISKGGNTITTPSSPSLWHTSWKAGMYGTIALATSVILGWRNPLITS